MAIPILKQGDMLIASMQESMTDHDLLELRDGIAERIGRLRSRGVIIDVTELDVLDSFGTRTLRGIAETARLRGAKAVIVGIQPDVALAMTQLGLTLGATDTVLDLEAALELLGVAVRTQSHDDGE